MWKKGTLNYSSNTLDKFANMKSANSIDYAACSGILFGMTPYHIPMIDFKGELTQSDCYTLTNELSEFGLKDYYLFKTDNSYHMYAGSLIKENQLMKYYSILLNHDCVDHRWVAFRILAGYMSLRISANSERFESVPKLVKPESLILKIK